MMVVQTQVTTKNDEVDSFYLRISSGHEMTCFIVDGNQDTFHLYITPDTFAISDRYGIKWSEITIAKQTQKCCGVNQEAFSRTTTEKHWPHIEVARSLVTKSKELWETSLDSSKMFAPGPLKGTFHHR